ncbi:hypothetical protein [Streptomyces microflavus]|uniref:hypothetical protein n=1 Tax=Streptomyces microflavus TaxID=1919 RepID=UPI00367471C9
MLPRLEAITDQLRPEDSDPVLLRRVDDARQLVTVMQYCLDTGAELHFGTWGSPGTRWPLLRTRPVLSHVRVKIGGG